MRREWIGNEIVVWIHIIYPHLPILSFDFWSILLFLPSPQSTSIFDTFSTLDTLSIYCILSSFHWIHLICLPFPLPSNHHLPPSSSLYLLPLTIHLVIPLIPWKRMVVCLSLSLPSPSLQLDGQISRWLDVSKVPIPSPSHSLHHGHILILYLLPFSSFLCVSDLHNVSIESFDHSADAPSPFSSSNQNILCHLCHSRHLLSLSLLIPSLPLSISHIPLRLCPFYSSPSLDPYSSSSHYFLVDIFRFSSIGLHCHCSYLIRFIKFSSHSNASFFLSPLDVFTICVYRVSALSLLRFRMSLYQGKEKKAVTEKLHS